jgi:predicted secreted protein
MMHNRDERNDDSVEIRGKKMKGRYHRRLAGIHRASLVTALSKVDNMLRSKINFHHHHHHHLEFALLTLYSFIAVEQRIIEC